MESILAQLRRPNKLIRKEKEFVCCRQKKEIGPVSGSGRRGPPGAPGLELDWTGVACLRNIDAVYLLKNFLQYGLHRIFRHICEILNIIEKNN